MAEEKLDPIKLLQEGTVVDQAMQKAARRALLQYLRAGLKAPEWRDGRVVFVDPRDVMTRMGLTEKDLDPNL